MWKLIISFPKKDKWSEEVKVIENMKKSKPHIFKKKITWLWKMKKMTQREAIIARW